MPNEWRQLVLNLLPELVLLAGGTLAVVLLVGRQNERTSRGPAFVSLLAVALAIVGPAIISEVLPAGQLSRHSPLLIDDAARAARWAALMLGVLLIGAQWALPERRDSLREHLSARLPPAATLFQADRAAPEFFMLLLCSLAGLMLTAAANDLIVLLLALELTSVPTIVAVALSRPRLTATEAGGKYFFLNVIATAILALGLAWLFGLTGQTNLAAISDAMFRWPGQTGSWVAQVGLALALAGLGFKIAAFPFHVYLADVYQGAAAPVAGWLAFVPKAAGFLAAGKLLVALGGPAIQGGPDQPAFGWIGQAGWAWLIWGLAVATMTAGNVLALWQRNVKRLLAYSSVAHSGYMLVGLLVVPDLAFRAGGAAVQQPAGLPVVLLFYLLAYGIANLGAFLVLASARVPENGVRHRFGMTEKMVSDAVFWREAETFEDLAGLSRRRPALAVAMTLFALSLMGLPPMVGFLAKVYIFVGAYRSGFTWLVVIALVNAAIGAAYYLRLIGACWLGKQAPGTPEELPAVQSDIRNPKSEIDSPPSLVIAILAALTVGFGLFPQGIFGRLTSAQSGLPKVFRPAAPPQAPPTLEPASPTESSGPPHDQ